MFEGVLRHSFLFFFFFNDTATTEIYTLSLHDALPISLYPRAPDLRLRATQDLSDGELFYIIENGVRFTGMPAWGDGGERSEEHTSELQSRSDLVCRLLLEKKKLACVLHNDARNIAVHH